MAIIWQGDVQVPRNFVGVHSIGINGAIPGWDDDETNFNYKIGAYRLYGSLPWRMMQPAEAVYDWSFSDALFERLRRSGTIHDVTWTYYEPPYHLRSQGQQDGNWQMQDVDYAAALAFTRNLLARYPEITIIECANEVITSDEADQGVVGGFWVGDEPSLSRWCEKVLDIANVLRAEGRAVSVLAPSIPGTISCLHPPQGYLLWLDRFPRRAEFVGVAAHFYRANGSNIDQPATAANGWTCLQALRDGLAQRGWSLPIHDNEHGFEFDNSLAPEVMAPIVFNYFVKAASLGIKNVTLFSSSRPTGSGDNLAYIGNPSRNAVVKAAIEDAHALLAGKRLLQIEDPGGGARYIVTTSEGASEPPPPPPPPPADDGGTGTGVRYTSWPTTDLSGPPDPEQSLTGLSQEWDDIDMSARFEGFIEAPAAGNISMRVTADDGVRVWLDDALVLDEWRQQSPTTFVLPLWSASLAGQRRRLKVEYFNLQWQGGVGSALLRVEWMYGGTPWHTVGEGRLFPPAEQPQPRACELPWGGMIAHGESVTAWQAASVPSGQQCVSETRTCNDGMLSGSFQFPSCAVAPPPPSDDTLTPRVEALERELVALNARHEERLAELQAVLGTARADIAGLLNSYNMLASSHANLSDAFNALRDKLRSV